MAADGGTMYDAPGGRAWNAGRKNRPENEGTVGIIAMRLKRPKSPGDS